MTSILRGKASLEGTTKRSQQSSQGWRSLGKTGLKVVPFGFGGYRVDSRVQTHHQALKKALEQGVNLIDTSSNYTHGHSEILVGKVLSEVCIESDFDRSEVVVVTKAGYLQGENLKIAQEKENNSNPYEEVVKLGDDLWHCIEPSFLEDQLNQSLKRMQLECIDFFLLHNPEYFLKANPAQQQEYYQRIKEAFSFLEEKVKEGKIQYYGISSNSFIEQKDHPEFTDIDKVLKCAQDLGKENHFACVQFPFNLIEHAAWTLKQEGLNLFQKAKQSNLAVLGNRPLNAFTGKKLLRLSSFTECGDLEELESEFDQALGALVRLEKEFFQLEVPNLQPFFLGHVLFKERSQIDNFLYWKDLYTFQLHPLLNQSLQACSQIPGAVKWAERHQDQCMIVLQLFTDLLEQQEYERNAIVSQWLDERSKDSQSTQELSHKVFQLYLSIKELDCILVGMREEKYIKNCLSAPKPFSTDVKEVIFQDLIEFTKKA